MNAGDIVAHLKARANEFRAGMNEARGSLDNFRRRAENVSRRLNDVGKKMTKFITLPIVGIAGAAVKTAAGFEASMNKVSALSGATGESLGKLRDLAMQMGRETRYSAVESADALSFLAMAGFEVEQSISALPSVLELAAAGNLDLATTADYASNIMTGFGMEAEEMARISDVLAATFTSSNTNLSQLAEGMKYVAPIAAGVGVEIEEAAAAMGILGDAGMQGSMAGTTLRTVLQRLLNPTGAAADIVADLGLQVNDAEGEFVGFVEIVRQLEEAGASTQDMMELFGARGAGMIAMVQRGSADFAEFTEELQNAEGTGARVSETMLVGLEGSITILRGSIETLLIVIGERFLPILTEWVDKAVEVVNEISEWDDEQWKLVGSIAGVLAIGGPFLIFLSKMINIVTALKLKMFVLKGGLTAMSGGMVAAGGATATLGTNLAALAAAGGPLMLVVAAAGLVAYAIYTMVQDSKQEVAYLADTVAAEIGQMVDNIALEQAKLLVNQKERHVAEIEAEMEHVQELVEQQEHRNNMLEILEAELSAAKAGEQEARHVAEIEAEIGQLEALIEQDQAKINRLTELEQELETAKLAAQRARHAQEMLAEQQFGDELASASSENHEKVLAAFDEFVEQHETARDEAMEAEIGQLVQLYADREHMTEEAFNVRLQHIKDKYAEEEMAFRTEHVPSFLAAHEEMLLELGLRYEAGLGKLVEIGDREAQALKVIMGKGGEDMIDALLAAIDAGEIPVAGAIEALAANIDGGMEEIRDIANDHGYHSITALMDGIAKGEPDAIEAAYAVGEGIGDSYGAGIDQSAPKAEQASIGLVQGVIRGAKNELQMRSPSQVFFAIGRSVADSMQRGILDRAAALARAAVDVVRRAIQAARAALGMSSPSKVGLNIGVNFIGSIEEGVESMSDRVHRAVSGALDFPGFNAPGGPTLPEPAMAGAGGLTGSAESPLVGAGAGIQERIDRAAGSMSGDQVAILIADRQMLKKLSRGIKEADIEEEHRGVR